MTEAMLDWGQGRAGETVQKSYQERLNTLEDAIGVDGLLPVFRSTKLDPEHRPSARARIPNPEGAEPASS